VPSSIEKHAALNEPETVGLIPAAGRASRISPLPCSKELFPVGFRVDPDSQSARPKVVAHYLLEKMRIAGIVKSYFVLRSGKWDIPAYFGSGSMLNMDLAYLTLDVSWGVPRTLDQAYPFVRDAFVAMGFPDILFGPDDAFVRLKERRAETHPDIVLGLCPPSDIRKDDAVAFGTDGIVKDLVLKPVDRTLPYSWAAALWTPAYTEFLHDYVRRNQVSVSAGPELTAGHAINAAVHAGLKVEAVVLGDAPYLDIGTPDNLARAIADGARSQAGDR